MRPMERLVLLADLLTFVMMLVPRLRTVPWTGYSALIAVLIASVQMLVERPRWQMVPGYALTGLFFLIWLLPGGPWADGAIPSRISTTLTAWLGGLGLLVSIALPALFPIFRFPQPGGPYQVGTLTYHWVDADRQEIFATDPDAPRELLAQIWYPARGGPSSVRAPYMSEADAVLAAFARLHQKPAFLFDHLKYVTTNAIPSAPVADGEPSYPVLLFFEGSSGFRQMNTFQVEELVSHGYVVVAIDQPYTAAALVFPDGRQAAMSSLDETQPLIRASYIPAKEPPVLNGQPIREGSILPYLAQDAIFTLDQLTILNQGDPYGLLTGRLDLQRVGAFGFSLGGIVVGEACRLEPRLHACLVMDAPMSMAVVESGLKQPSMWITRDAEDMRLERRRAGGWSEVEIHAHQASMRAVFEGLPGAGYFVQVPGAFHVNFMDLPKWLPLTSQMGITGPINGARAHRIINAYTLAFFNRHVIGRPAPLLDGPADQYPEVLLELRRP